MYIYLRLCYCVVYFNLHAFFRGMGRVGNLQMKCS